MDKNPKTSTQKMTGRGPGFERPPGTPFRDRGPDATYKVWREGTAFSVQLRIFMAGEGGCDYGTITLEGVGSDGLPIQLSYKTPSECRIAISMFRHMRVAPGMAWEQVHDLRGLELQRDLAE